MSVGDNVNSRAAAPSRAAGARRGARLGARLAQVRRSAASLCAESLDGLALGAASLGAAARGIVALGSAALGAATFGATPAITGACPQEPSAELPGAPTVPNAVLERLALEGAGADDFAHETLVTALSARLSEALHGAFDPAHEGEGAAATAGGAFEPLFGGAAGPVRLVPLATAPQRSTHGPLATDSYLSSDEALELAPPGAAAAVLAALEDPAAAGGGERNPWAAPPWKVKVLRAERTAPDAIEMRVKLTPRPLLAGAERRGGFVEATLEWRLAPAREGSAGREESSTRDESSAREASPAREDSTAGEDASTREGSPAREGATARAADPAAWSVAGWRFERAEVATSRARLVDAASEVFRGPTSARLVPSIPALRLGLDAELGIGFLGHHGLAVGDVDGDGIDDVYLCQPGGVPDQLWVRGSDGRARDVARELELDLSDASVSALFVDLDGDGDQDLVRTTADALLVHANRGGKFPLVHATEVSGATSLAAADVDLDGKVDLFLCTYGSPYTGAGMPLPFQDARNGTPNLLLANRTAERDAPAFEDVTEAAGMGGPDQRYSFAAAFEDFDDDGDSDLYVANDFGRNRLWRNDSVPGGAIAFVDVARETGVEDVGAGMGVTWADFDLDGRSDVYVSNMFSSAGNRISFDPEFQPAASDEAKLDYRSHAAGNSLYLARGERFAYDASPSLGLWSWGGISFELDGDGRPDLYVPNGFITGTNPEDL